jgi:hypothetical protein
VLCHFLVKDLFQDGFNGASDSLSYGQACRLAWAEGLPFMP